MNLFDEAMLRLKQQLKVTEDKETAGFLGISPRALAGRKQRESFPTKEVFALAAQRPELGLDPDWIVTGHSHKTETDGIDETSLLECYRKMNTQRKHDMRQIALLWSGEMKLIATKSTTQGETE